MTKLQKGHRKQKRTSLRYRSKSKIFYQFHVTDNSICMWYMKDNIAKAFSPPLVFHKMTPFFFDTTSTFHCFLHPIFLPI